MGLTKMPVHPSLNPNNPHAHHHHHHGRHHDGMHHRNHRGHHHHHHHHLHGHSRNWHTNESDVSEQRPRSASTSDLLTSAGSSLTKSSALSRSSLSSSTSSFSSYNSYSTWSYSASSANSPLPEAQKSSHRQPPYKLLEPEKRMTSYQAFFGDKKPL